MLRRRLVDGFVRAVALLWWLRGRGISVAGNGDVLIVNGAEKRIVVWQAPQ